VQALDAARSRQNFAVLAYVIMPEHAHVLVYPRDDKADVSAFLKSVKQSVARKARLHLAEYAPEWIRRLSVRTPSGPVFRFWQQGPGFDRNIYSLDALRSEIEYIHNNPVRRGLTKSPAEWEWTSAQWLSNPGVGRLKIDSIDEIFE
jgi:putative transposase